MPRFLPSVLSAALPAVLSLLPALVPAPMFAAASNSGTGTTSDTDWVPVLNATSLRLRAGGTAPDSPPGRSASADTTTPVPPSPATVRFDVVGQPLGLVLRQLAHHLNLPYLAPPDTPPLDLLLTLHADAEPASLFASLATHHGLRPARLGDLWTLEHNTDGGAVERFHELRHRTLEEFVAGSPASDTLQGSGNTSASGNTTSAPTGATPSADVAAAIERVRTVLGTGPDTPTGVLWDPALARFWVRAPAAAQERLARHLAELDTPVPQVLLEVRFIQTSEQPEKLFGVSWNLAQPGGFGGGITNLTGELDLNHPRALRLPTATWSLDDFTARLQMLDRDQRRHEVRLVRQTGPSGRPLSFRDTQRIPVVQSTARLGTDTLSSQSNVEFLDVGTMVDLVPRVLADGAVALRLDLVVSSVIGSVRLDGNDFPVTSRQAYAGEAVVPAGGTLALGGFERTLDSTEEAGLPGLRRLPAIGPLFGTRGRRGDRTHLVILLTPRVLEVAAPATP